jgi:hypothetical protein
LSVTFLSAGSCGALETSGVADFGVFSLEAEAGASSFASTESFLVGGATAAFAYDGGLASAGFSAAAFEDVGAFTDAFAYDGVSASVDDVFADDAEAVPAFVDAAAG